MNRFCKEKIERVLDTANEGIISDDLFAVIYSLGRDAANAEEYDYAINILERLSKHSSISVISMVILAYSLLAVYHGHLEREKVEPVIQQAWAAADGIERTRIRDATEDINCALKWDINLS